MSTDTTTTERRFTVDERAGSVSAVLRRPASTRGLLVLGHGAGAGMRHPFMEGMAEAFAAHGIATFRYQFPYLESGHRRPDPRPVLLATVRAAVEVAADTAPDVQPLLAGGKSMGGRMTSLAQAESPLPGVGGIVFLGFPLHPAGRHSTTRSDHLADVGVPMLFLQGTRDRLADLDLLRPVGAGLGGRAQLHVVDGADHGFAVLKRSGRSDADVRTELAAEVSRWASAVVADRP